MKRLSLVIAFMLCLATMSFAQNIKVNSSQKPDTDFDKYKSFNFASQVDQKLDPGFYFLNDLALKGMIRESVNHELEGLGYKKTTQAPDLIVNFRVFDKPATITTVNDYGNDYWGISNVRDTRSISTAQVQAGTLVVNMVDRKTGEVVWTGFASGLMDGNLFNKKEDKVKEAVNLVFDQYKHRADGITTKR